ncbi:acetylornithine aminotransferase [Sporothrix eucalyptigena]|uniref:acetylornithine transaminase n=1 Tax=Sporothrix eucalyptigena TaxID=1812306 RepID=A0ABP0CL67_9PEZI
MVWRTQAVNAAKTARSAVITAATCRASASIVARPAARTISSTSARRMAATPTQTAVLEREQVVEGLHSPEIVAKSDPYMVATYSRPAPVFERGAGTYLWDLEGKKYLDLTAGIAVNGLGHCDAEITRVLADQAGTLMHASNLYHNIWTGTLSRQLVEETQKSGGMAYDPIKAVFIANSGSEANEAAIKFARKVGKARDPSGKKTDIVSFSGAFHGRTMGSLSATHNPKYQKPFAPMVPGFRCGTFNDADPAVLEALVTPETCAVIVEPIQGEGGVNVGTEEFMVALARRCRDVGAVLIHDEIQCGLARTGGTLWAHAHLPKEAHPDIVTTAKALGNGFPIGATLVSGTVADAMKIGDHGTTFGGNPLACRVAYHVLARLSDPKLQADVVAKGAVFVRGLQQLREKYPDIISEIRGRGLILGAQLTCDPNPIIEEARNQGLLVISCGTNTLRFVPPLNISEAEIQEGLGLLDKAIAATRS